jgi:hypothetical protein
VRVREVVVLCAMCFGELMSHGNVGLCVFVCACARVALWGGGG